jgi:hypothetical protein
LPDWSPDAPDAADVAVVPGTAAEALEPWPVGAVVWCAAPDDEQAARLPLTATATRQPVRTG